jgi:hypothetical protein
MKTVNISLETAKEMQSSGIESLKKMAEETYPELVVPKQKTWEEFFNVEGYYIGDTCAIKEYDFGRTYNSNRNTHPTEKEAESALALSQLRQWRDKANGGKLFDWADWADSSQDKYCIWRCLNRINSNGYHTSVFHELAFKTEEIRDQFLIDHLDLIKTYFMI